jgi:hypothetical protein
MLHHLSRKRVCCHQFVFFRDEHELSHPYNITGRYVSKTLELLRTNNKSATVEHALTAYLTQLGNVVVLRTLIDVKMRKIVRMTTTASVKLK